MRDEQREGQRVSEGALGHAVMLAVFCSVLSAQGWLLVALLVAERVTTGSPPWWVAVIAAALAALPTAALVARGPSALRDWRVARGRGRTP